MSQDEIYLNPPKVNVFMVRQHAKMLKGVKSTARNKLLNEGNLYYSQD